MNDNQINKIMGLLFNACYIYILKYFASTDYLGSLFGNKCKTYYNQVIQKQLLKIKHHLADIECMDGINGINGINISSDEVPHTPDHYMYSLKIKCIGDDKPCLDHYNESDIYVDKKNERFYVKSKNVFNNYPLKQNSIIKCKQI